MVSRRCAREERASGAKRWLGMVCRGHLVGQKSRRRDGGGYTNNVENLSDEDVCLRESNLCGTKTCYIEEGKRVNTVMCSLSSRHRSAGGGGFAMRLRLRTLEIKPTQHDSSGVNYVCLPSTLCLDC